MVSEADTVVLGGIGCDVLDGGGGVCGGSVGVGVGVNAVGDGGFGFGSEAFARCTVLYAAVSDAALSVSFC